GQRIGWVGRLYFLGRRLLQQLARNSDHFWRWDVVGPPTPGRGGGGFTRRDFDWRGLQAAWCGDFWGEFFVTQYFRNRFAQILLPARAIPDLMQFDLSVSANQNNLWNGGNLILSRHSLALVKKRREGVVLLLHELPSDLNLFVVDA